MKCAECNCWVDGACIADPNWPAPCEYEEEPIEEEEDPCIGCPHEGFGSEHCAAVIGDYCRAGDCIIEDEDPSCSTCYNADQDTTDKVACCNCCEDYCFYTRA